MRQLLLSTGLVISMAAPSLAADLSIVVSNIREPVGQLLWLMYDSEEAYTSDSGPMVSAKFRVDGDSMRVTVHDVPKGRYAIKLFHDANGNDELDTNVLGIPTEGYGFSNNAGRFGPPSFEEAAVEVDADTTANIRVR